MQHFIAEIQREIDMRKKVYPGRVKAKKMTQATSDKKIELMREIGVIFKIAETEQKQPAALALPLYEPDDSPYPITTLSLHIKEVRTEISWREHRLTQSKLGAATKILATEQLQTMKDILAVLETIQGPNATNPKSSQQQLF